MLWRAMIAVLCAAATGVTARVDPAHMAADRAVANRLEVWRGGAQMIAAAPWLGWGAGESGRAYMNWFQPIEREERYATLVNSYLHIGAEGGLAALTVVVFAVAWCLLAGLRAGQLFRPGERMCVGSGGNAWLHAAVASVVAWAAANAFSTLWEEPGLWVVPGLALGVVITFAAMKDTWRSPRVVMGAWAAAALVGAGVWLLGTSAARSLPLRVTPIDRGAALQIDRLARPLPARPASWEIWPDPAVLGPVPGKEIRRWMAEPDGPARLVYQAPAPGRSASFGSASAASVLLCGRHATRLGRQPAREGVHYVLLHPSGPCPGPLPRTIASRLTVILPEIDAAGNRSGWTRWAADAGARVILSRGVGTDVRADWPRIMNVLEDEMNRTKSPSSSRGADSVGT